MKAGNKVLEMHKFCVTNIKLIKKEEDRKIIQEITQTKIFTNLTIKEMATIMRVYRDLKHSSRDNNDTDY